MISYAYYFYFTNSQSKRKMLYVKYGKKRDRGRFPVSLLTAFYSLLKKQETKNRPPVSFECFLFSCDNSLEGIQDILRHIVDVICAAVKFHVCKL